MAKIKMNEEAKACRKYFYETYQKVKERPYNASFQKDGMLFYYICNRFPEHWVLGFIDFYLQWQDEFVKNTGYTVGVFYSKINQMLELNIHKSHWSKGHEKRTGLTTAKNIIAGMAKDFVK